MSHPQGRPTVAIAAHVYYSELWPELAAMIRHVPEPFALFVTIPEADTESAVLAGFPEAIVRRVPNVGRDVAPFLALLPELGAFDLVCKLHTKGRYRSWRIESLRGLLGGRDLVELVLHAFSEVPELMMAGSGALFIDGDRYVYGSRDRLKAFQPERPEAFGFFAGTMFWTRPRLFADLVEAFPTTHFVPHRDGDGQLEHLVERLFGLRVATLGGSVGLTSSRNGRPQIEIVPATVRRTANFVEIADYALPQRYELFPEDWFRQPELVTGHPLGPLDPYRPRER